MLVKCPHCKIKGPKYQNEDCMGNPVTYTCKYCKGTGEIEEEKIKKEYKIPKGTTEFKILNGYFERGDSDISIPQLRLKIIVLKQGSREIEKKLDLKISDSAWRYCESDDLKGG